MNNVTANIADSVVPMYPENTHPVALEALHHVEFQARGEEGAAMVTEVWRHVHAFNREHGNCLGVDFPAWTAGSALPEALAIRVFGAKETLSRFIGQSRAARLQASGAVVRGAVSACPVATEFAAVLRDSSANKNSPSHARRRARRGKDNFSGVVSTTQFSAPYSSESTGHDFLLKIKKGVAARTGLVAFNSYGMCFKSAVPQF